MKTKILLSSFLLCSVLLSYGQWTYDSLSLPRNWMGAASFGTKAYFGGGETDFGNASIVEIYDVETGTWDTPRNLSVGRSTLSAVACDSLVFFAGGFDVNTIEASSDIDIWDTRTQQWSIAQLSVPRFALSALSLNHEVLFAGGLIYDLNGYSDVDIYNTQTGTWTWSTDFLSMARGAMAAAVVGDLAIFAGGLLPGANVTDRVDIYNSNTSAWSTATLSQARCMAVAITVGNKVVIAGGMTKGFGNPSDRVDIYDAETDTWDIASLSVARAYASAATINGKAYFVGGSSFGSGAVLYDFTNIIDIYDPESDTWTVDYLTQPVASHSVVGVGDYLVVAGGKTNGILRVNTVEIFHDPSSGITPGPKNDEFFRVYPNPSNGSFHLEILKGNRQKPMVAMIYNLQGQVVFNQTLAPGDQELLNVNLSSGVYVLSLNSSEASQKELITIK